MTREEAKQILVFQSNCKHNNSTIPKTVDEIYDDFESRTCENCRYFTNRGSFCTEHEAGTYIRNRMPKDFGCNKFKPKE